MLTETMIMYTFKNIGSLPLFLQLLNPSISNNSHIGAYFLCTAIFLIVVGIC